MRLKSKRQKQRKLKSNYERQNFICVPEADGCKWNARERSQTKWDVSLIKHNKLDILIKIMASSRLKAIFSPLIHFRVALTSLIDKTFILESFMVGN